MNTYELNTLNVMLSAQDKATHHVYFYNAVTGESTWEPPHVDLSYALQEVQAGLRDEAIRTWAATKIQSMVRAHQCQRQMSTEKRASRSDSVRICNAMARGLGLV